MDHRTIISHIDSLISFGIDISKYSDNRKGYYLRERDFEDSEIDLLCHCIHSSHFIPEKHSNALINKLNEKQSVYKRKKFKNQVYIGNTKKTKNKELFLNIETLGEAIEQKKMVSFKYHHYNDKKELIPTREKLYSVQPLYIIQENDNLYMICKHVNYDNFSHYRIDKMKEITILNLKCDYTTQSFDPYIYAKNKKFMFNDKECRVYLKCDKKMLDDVIDQFGQDIIIQKNSNEENSYFISLTSSTQGIIYFALQYLKFCEILEPHNLREEIKTILHERLQKYL